MEIQTVTLGDVLVAAPQVEVLMANTVDEFRRDILPLLNGQRKVILDLSAVKFMDSSGIGVLLSCLRQLDAQHGHLKLIGMNKAIKGVFQLTRMYRLMDGFDTRDEALRAFKGPG